eukprot:TRINITY_DN2753_c0_g2_i3.p1 TRINITY_DN2753_c0_g2~~TRINITY_DN2753_c0_g2_i3.p1  ORF type:complete len:848 (+),score=118.04 TRINITY_DN2753_c0_g2_i3:107-2650(+)
MPAKRPRPTASGGAGRHPRHLCPDLPFEGGEHESYCEGCDCWFCGIPAGGCAQWSLHQHANDTGPTSRSWILARSVAHSQAAPSTFLNPPQPVSPIPLGRIDLPVKIRNELVQIRDWQGLREAMDSPQPEDLFESLFVDFRFCGGRTRGALVGADREGREKISAICSSNLLSETHQPAVNLSRFQHSDQHSLFASVQLSESAPKRGRAEISLYLNTSVAMEKQDCSVPMELLSCLFPQNSLLQDWGGFRASQLQALQQVRFGIRHVLDTLGVQTPTSPEPSPTDLQCELYSFQQDTLAWMLWRERNARLSRDLWLPLCTLPAEQSVLSYSPTLTQWRLETESTPTHGRGSHATGGFLCEEMGLGKTVETLGLVLANPAEPNAAATGTLVICPVSLVGQWQAECRAKAPGLSCYVYHGPNRIRIKDQLTRFDLVVTSYPTLAAEFRSESVHRLGLVPWHRCILDESHHIKSRSTGVLQACQEIEARHKWCVTGTPIESCFRDLEGQLAFLEMVPLASDPAVFKKKFLTPLETASKSKGNTPTQAIQALWLIQRCMVRHTKKRVTTGLPPCTEEVDLVTLGPSESELYQRVTSERLVQFNQLVHHSQTKVSSLGFKMHLLMLPMRQICAGGEIQVSSPDSGALTYSELPATATECPICQDFLEEPVKTPCSHWFCRDCLLHYFAVRGGDLVPCPYCRHQCHESQLAHYHQPSREPALVRKIETKLLAVLTRLSLTLSRDPHSKILLFSSFAGTLEWLAHRMRRDEIQFETINGTMSLAQRTSAIRAFQYNPASRVFLLSVRAGAVGINLTAAVSSCWRVFGFRFGFGFGQLTSSGVSKFRTMCFCSTRC